MIAKKKFETMLLILGLFIPILGGMVFQITANNPENPDQIDSDLNWEFGESNIPQNSAPSEIKFDDGVKLIDSLITSANNITDISTYDYYKEGTTANLYTEDLIACDLGGNIYIIQGAPIGNEFSNLNPAANKVMKYTIGSPDDDLIFVTHHQITLNEEKQHLVAFPTSGESKMLVYGEPTYFSRDFLDEGDYTAYDKNPMTGSELTGETINTIFQTEFQYPHINNEYLVGTSSGKIVLTQTSDSLATRNTEVLVNSGSSGVLDLDVGDINLDGQLDIIALYNNGSIIAFFAENEDYINWNSQIVLENIPGINHMVLRDLDQNNMVDLIATSSDGQVYFLTDFSASSGFTSTYIKNDFQVLINDVLGMDFDQDSDSDIVVALDNGSIGIMENPWVYYKNYSAAVREELWKNSALNITMLTSTENTLNQAALSLFVTDYNWDGWPDIISGHENGEIYGWKNLGYNKVNEFVLGREKLITGPIGRTLVDLEIGDYDADGDNDIIAVYNGGGIGYSYLKIFLNPGTRNPYLSDYENLILFSTAQEFKDITLVDLDHDGLLDIIFQLSSGYVYAIENQYDNSSGIEFNQVNIFAGLLYSYHTLFWLNHLETSLYGTLNMGDFNADGEWDILQNGQNGNLTIYPQDPSLGYGNFESESWVMYGSGNIMVNTTDGGRIIGSDFQHVLGYTPDLSGAGINLNVQDIVFGDFDGNIYFLPGTNIIPAYRNEATPDHIIYSNSSVSLRNSFLVNDPSNHVPSILIGGNDEIEGEYHGFLASLSKIDYNNLEPTSWFYYNHYNHPVSIFDIQRVDLNNDNLDDIVFLDEENKIYCAKGLDDYLFNVVDEFEVELLYEFPYQLKVSGGIKFADMDNDGDQDLILITASNEVYLVRNALNDDIDDDFVSIEFDPLVSATDIDIIISLNNGKISDSAPIIEIEYNGQTDYQEMNVDVQGTTYSLTYSLLGNGTYYLSTTIMDQWGNLAYIEEQFYGDFIEPGLEYEIKYSNENYVQGTIEMFIFNTTEEIGNNNVGLTISLYGYYTHYFETNFSYDPLNWEPNQLYYIGASNNTERNSLGYSGNGTWWIYYNQMNENGLHNVEINATDRFQINYTYLETSFINDDTIPDVLYNTDDLFEERRTLPLLYTSLSIDNPFIPLRFNFTEDIMSMMFWVEDLDGNNVMFGDIKYINKTDIGDSYVSNFRTTEVENLVIRMVIVDYAGNINSEVSYQFYLEPFSIVFNQNWYFLVSELGDKSTTYRNNFYAHFKGSFIYEFRFGIQKSGESSINWTEWEDYNTFSDEYYHPYDYTLGYRLSVPENEFGNYSVILSIRNSYETIESNAKSINYSAVPSTQFDWSKVLIPTGAVVGVFVVLYLLKKMRKSNEWKQYLNDSDEI